ncbi:MAG: DbpA RNA binding domain-containing protein [Treponemataceae bacterium]
MSASRIASKKNEEDISSLCAEIIQRIKTQEDPIALNEFRSFVKKNVPFFMRSYFSAFLLKQLYDAAPRAVRKGPPERKYRNDARNEGRGDVRSDARGEVRLDRRGESRSARETVSEVPASQRKVETPRREDIPRRSLSEGEAATLFIGVGRNRRAYARELLAFITNNAEIDADSIGELRVLDNFSFVQVKKEAAETVIENLNGKEYRGRMVSVSYAKPRKEESKEPPADDYSLSDNAETDSFDSDEPAESNSSKESDE